MMKNRQTIKMMMSALFFLVAILGYSQEAVDTTIVLNPGEWIPADTGYYLMGVDKDLIGDDGVTEHYDGCYDAYGDDDHREGGEQFGWEYGNVIIFRGCDTDPGVVDDVIKGTQPEENWPSVGNIIQLGKMKYGNSDSMQIGGYLISPEFTSLSKLEVKVGTDVSINNSRSIWIMIEASADGGQTWEYFDNNSGTAYIHQQLTNQGGDIHTYTAGSNDGFDAIAALSESGAIKLRIQTVFPQFGGGTGERLKIWEVTIEGKTVPTSGGGGNEDVLSAKLPISKSFTISDDEIVAARGLELSVYTLSGVMVGSGQSVHVCNSGLYVVKTTDGQTKKIYLK